MAFKKRKKKVFKLRNTKKVRQAKGQSMIFHLAVVTVSGVVLGVFSHLVSSIDLLSSAVAAAQVVFVR